MTPLRISKRTSGVCATLPMTPLKMLDHSKFSFTSIQMPKPNSQYTQGRLLRYSHVRFQCWRNISQKLRKSGLDMNKQQYVSIRISSKYTNAVSAASTTPIVSGTRTINNLLAVFLTEWILNFLCSLIYARYVFLNIL